MTTTTEQLLVTREQEDEEGEVQLQQLLWSRRNTLTSCTGASALRPLQLLDLLQPAQNDSFSTVKSPATTASTAACSASFYTAPPPCPTPPPSTNNEDLASTWNKHDPPSSGGSNKIWVDAGLLGELPARYAISDLYAHEMAAIGAYIDPRIMPGFRYKVRTLEDDSRPLFRGRPLTLLSIGRGYGRRLTFQADVGNLNSNSNYFWSDSCPEGFALELDVVSTGDKFTVMDANHVPTATLELLHVQGPQVESVSDSFRVRGREKAVRVRALCRVDWFESGEEQVVPMSGLALVTSARPNTKSSPPRMVQVALGSHLRGFSLIPGAGHLRRTTVHGARIGDVPTSYTVVGLETHEMPVVGTYVDPRISSGFHYRVRRVGGAGGRWLFGGRALRLVSIGAGYAKRITFQPDHLNQPQNFFWSDSSHGDGYAFEIRGVLPGQRFWISAGGERLGEASVFRADVPHSEESSETLSNGAGLLKKVRIDVTCHVSLEGAATQAMRVSGTAVLQRNILNKPAKLLRVEDIGMDSQLNVLFTRERANVVFYPLPPSNVRPQ